MERIKTGISAFDSILGGGFPIPSFLLIQGYPGTGKSTFIRQFTYNANKEGKKIIYFTTAESPESIKKQMEELSFKIEKKENVKFIDCYSWRTNSSKQGEYVIVSPSNLTEMISIIKKAIRDMKFKNGVVIIDSVTDLLLQSEKTSVFKFMQLVSGQVKTLNSIGIIVIEEGAHDEKTLATINYLTDGTIKMKIEDAKRYLRIQRMMDTLHPLEWISFEIKKGIEIKVQEFFG